MDKQLYEKITKKKEYSKLLLEDVERIFSLFDKKDYLDEEKIKLTREKLMKAFSVFTSRKLLTLKEKPFEWILKKHASTRERLSFYPELYSRLIKGEDIVFDLGCGVNGFSYPFFKKKIRYVGVEGIGQLVDLTNFYFEKNNINSVVFHESLFNLEKIRKIIKKEKGKKVIFLFKALDSLEMVERNFSKRFLKEIVPFADKVVVSFINQSLLKKEKFRATHKWLVNFIKENFKILDDFELGGERYISFSI